MKQIRSIICLVGLTLGLTAFTTLKPFDAEADKIQGTWLNQEGTAHVQIFKAANGQFAGKYYGKIVWLKEPNENGKPKVDKENPIASKKTKPLMGLMLLNDFSYDSDEKEWSGGTIYDPKNGKTYSCYITMDGNKLNVRGYIGISIIGRTAVWTRVK
ncbi:MAG: DUF2147 domain-containing protein [Bacteroidia bacterium]|nr:DUF2147 domain-containing protein [Bacteroidia bacterium]